MLSSRVITGLVVSTTLTTLVTWSATFPLLSVTLNVTVYVPTVCVSTSEVSVTMLTVMLPS